MNSMMNNPRIFLWILLIMAGWLNYEAWTRDYAPRIDATNVAQQPGASTTPDLGAAVPKGGTESAPAVPGASAAVPATAPVPGATASSAPTAAEVPAGTAGVGGVPVHVKTDVLDLDIDLKGGPYDRLKEAAYKHNLKVVLYEVPIK